MGLLICFGILLTSSFHLTIASPVIMGVKIVPDFRSLKLLWKANDDVFKKDPRFLVTYCENQVWGKHRCRHKMIDKTRERNNMDNIDHILKNFVDYEARISGLKMATNYTVEIGSATGRPGEMVKRGRALSHDIFTRTKGFYARAINCYANSSLVEIETGPFFGGKISVEGSNSKGCSVEGNMSSSQSSYILNIDHYKCGSEIRNTSVKTYLIVQENVPILTHSTRRFMIICRYMPATFTVRAGVNLPSYDEVEGELLPIGKKIVEVDPTEIFDSTNSLFSSRVGKQVGRALKFSSEKQEEGSEKWSHLILMVVMVVAALVGVSVAIFYFVAHARRPRETGEDSVDSEFNDSSTIDGTETASQRSDVDALTDADSDLQFHTDVTTIINNCDDRTTVPSYTYNGNVLKKLFPIENIDGGSAGVYENLPDKSIDCTIDYLDGNLLSETASHSFSDFIPSKEDGSCVRECAIPLTLSEEPLDNLISALKNITSVNVETQDDRQPSSQEPRTI